MISLAASACEADSASVPKSRNGVMVSAGQVGPDDAARFVHRVGGDLDLVREAVQLRPLVGALAGDVELPAVVGAAQPAFLVAPVEQRRAAVRALLLDQPYRAIGVPERHEILAEQPDPRRGAVGFGNLLAQARGYPVPPQQVSHRRARADPGEDLVVFR